MQNNSIIIYSVKFIVIIIISEYPNTVILFGFQSRMCQSYTMGSSLFLVHTLTFTIRYMISCPLAIVDKEFNNWIFRLCLLICLPTISCPCITPNTNTMAYIINNHRSLSEALWWHDMEDISYTHSVTSSITAAAWRVIWSFCRKNIIRIGSNYWSAHMSLQ